MSASGKRYYITRKGGDPPRLFVLTQGLNAVQMQLVKRFLTEEAQESFSQAGGASDQSNVGYEVNMKMIKYDIRNCDLMASPGHNLSETFFGRGSIFNLDLFEDILSVRGFGQNENEPGLVSCLLLSLFCIYYWTEELDRSTYRNFTKLLTDALPEHTNMEVINKTYTYDGEIFTCLSMSCCTRIIPDLTLKLLQLKADPNITNGPPDYKSVLERSCFCTFYANNRHGVKLFQMILAFGGDIDQRSSHYTEEHPPGNLGTVLTLRGILSDESAHPLYPAMTGLVDRLHAIDSGEFLAAVEQHISRASETRAVCVSPVKIMDSVAASLRVGGRRILAESSSGLSLCEVCLRLMLDAYMQGQLGSVRVPM